jgi:hypothetical protein
MRESQHVEYEASGSGQASPLTRNPMMMGRQDFSRVHTADNSRNHFGNVYNNIYQDNAAHPEYSQVALELMDALAFRGMTDRVMAISPACAETCAWFLHSREYTSWRDPSRRHAHNGVLWIKGKAGTGKSTLMRYIHDHACQHHQEEVDIAFFLNGRSPDQLVKSVEGMYRSILYQLYNQIPRLKAAAAKRVAISNKQFWSIGVLEDMIRQSVFHLAPDEKATVYIDALDECELDQVRSAVEFFDRLSRSATTEKKQFFICFSSRYYPHITMHSHEEVKLDTLVEHSSDIKTFLNSELTIQSPFRSELQAEIEKRCSGIFLWVVLVVKLLKRDFDEGATRTRLSETLKALPQELNELFAKITESAGSDFAIAIRWVLYARVSLHPSQLYFAIQTSLGHLGSVCWDRPETNILAIRNYILHVSRGLIECTWESAGKEAVQFVHESVREYLRSCGLASLSGISYHELETTSHGKMLESCQKYLEHCARCRVKSLPPRNVDVGHEDARQFLCSHPLLDYVLYHVFTHMELAHTAGRINHGLLDAFPLSDFVAFYNIYEAPPYNQIERRPTGCAVLANHTATLLMLLISFQCYNLVELKLQTQPGLIKRSQKFVRPSAAAGPDLTTCCGGPMPSPLHAAVASGREALVELLLEKGADANIPGYMSLDGVLQLYDTPLTMAVEHSSAAMVKLLLDHGACVDTLSPQTGWSALHQACLSYNLEKIELLLSCGATVDLRSGPRSGVKVWTALHLACDRRPNHTQDSIQSVLRALLDAGADVNATTKEDLTPLILIVKSSRKLEGAKFLLDYGANTEYRSTTRGTAIAAANPEIAEALASRIRRRALQGRNRYLRRAPRMNIPFREGLLSRIAAPVRPHSRRRELPLQYRYPPKSRPPQINEREYADALTDANLQLWNEAEGGDPYVTLGSWTHELDDGDESDWSNAAHVDVR